MPTWALQRQRLFSCNCLLPRRVSKSHLTGGSSDNDRTYLVSNSIINLYYTQLIGDPNDKPIIKATPNFDEFAFGLIDANPYQPGGTLAWNSTNTFFRQIRNLILDTTQVAPDQRAVGIHWPSSQATAITNCVFRLSSAPGNSHIGIFIEEGSGGLLNDLIFIGGGPAAVFGNQQYTARNLAFYKADVAIEIPWNWGWTFKSIYMQDCRVGIQMDREKAATGSVTLLDSEFVNVETAINTTRGMADTLGTNGTLAMEHVRFEGVSTIVSGPDGVILNPSNAVKSSNALFIMVCSSIKISTNKLTYHRDMPLTSLECFPKLGITTARLHLAICVSLTKENTMSAQSHSTLTTLHLRSSRHEISGQKEMVVPTIRKP